MTAQSRHVKWPVAAGALPVEVAEALRREGIGIGSRDGIVVAELRGVSSTRDEGGEDLAPARAIRRALADGALSARDVGLVAVHAVGARAGERARHAVARGLGRFAADVNSIFDDPAVLSRCVAAIARQEVVVAVALTIDPATGNLAVAFSRPR